MLHNNGKYTCDHEIGKPGNWHICNRKATWQRMSATLRTLHFCERHTDVAKNPTNDSFRPYPGTVAEKIAY